MFNLLPKPLMITYVGDQNQCQVSNEYNNIDNSNDQVDDHIVKIRFIFYADHCDNQIDLLS